MNRMLLISGTAAIVWLWASGAQAATRNVALPELAKPRCDAPLTPNADATACVLPPGVDAAQYTQDTCPTLAGFTFTTACVFEPTLAARPACDRSVANLVLDPTSKTCQLVVGETSSGAGDYVGDCFKVAGRPVGSTLQPDRYYTVTDQQDLPDDDRLLTVVSGQMSWVPIPGLFGCRAVSGPQQKVSAASLMQNGASRLGWAYGVLAMPYKYYPGSKSFVTGLPPIGAYLGWRVGRAGSGTTIAAAVTLGTVRADTVDPKTKDANGNPAVTGSADVTALSAAAGVVFDISKRPGFKAFKAGFFVGRDRINRSDTVSYRNDGKTWIALQLGFDFTDN
ncbi:MAG: hypothetical protein AB9M60_03815 [Leptothrix sp. (in: b-proteobacteria)]